MLACMHVVYEWILYNHIYLIIIIIITIYCYIVAMRNGKVS